MYPPNVSDWTPPNSEYPPPKSGEPPLHRAARTGDAEAILRSIKEGVNVDQAFDIGLDPGAYPTTVTPLMEAAGSGDGADVETVRLLLSLGADAKVEIEGRTAMYYAVAGLGWNYRPSGDGARLGLLVEAGCPLPSNREQANRLICAAARRGDLSMLRVIVGLGVDPKGYWDKEKEEARQRTLFSSKTSNFETLYDYVQERFDSVVAKPAPYSFQLPLFCAAESGSAECVQYLVDLGADVTIRDSRRRTALWYVGSAAVADLLVELGLSVEERGQFNWNPLDDAVQEGLEGLDRARWLIEAGANVNATHDRGYTVFMSAASSMERHIEVLRLLVASGADPHAVSELGYNAFHAAVDAMGEANEEDSVRSVFGYLNDLGVSLTQRNNRGQTPLEYAQEEGSELDVLALRELMGKD